MTDRHSGNEYLDDILARLDSGELKAKPAEARPAGRDPRAWTQPFRQAVRDQGLVRYARELARIDAGELPENDLLIAFRAAWADRKPWDGAILIGHTGIGKSVAALDACREATIAGVTWRWADFGELAAAWRSYDEDMIKRWAGAPLLVVDEVGQAGTATPGAFQLFATVLNLRYRNDRPTILATVDNMADVEKAIGPELVNRFPIVVAARQAVSFRPTPRKVKA